MAESKLDKKVVFAILSFFLFFCLLFSLAIYLITQITNNTGKTTEVLVATPSIAPSITNVVLPTEQLKQNLVLEFKNVKFSIYGTNNEALGTSYWSSIPEIHEVQNVEALYEFFSNNKGDLYYIPSKDSYYGLEPSGSNSWSLVDENYINKNTGTQTKTLASEDNEPTTIKTTCTKGLRKIGNAFFSSLECKEVFSTKIEGKDTIVQESYISKCLYNYSPGKYLMFSQDTASAGSDKDACAILNTLGFENIELNK